MKRSMKFLMALSIPLIWGCGVIAQSIAPTETLQTTATMIASDTPTAVIEASDTPAPSATASPSETPNSLGVSLPPMFSNLNNISQYFNPSGQPVKSWNDIPIMPQATAGQDWNNGVYSYKANATLNQAVAFYGKFSRGGMPSMPPATGSAGTGSNALHNATFLYPNLIIHITSFDNNPTQVIVVFSTQK